MEEFQRMPAEVVSAAVAVVALAARGAAEQRRLRGENLGEAGC